MTEQNLLNFAEDLMKKSLAAGADAAEVMIARGSEQSVQVRNGEIEHTEYAVGDKISLRVYIGEKAGSASASSLNAATVENMTLRAVNSAKYVPEDPYGGLAEKADLETEWNIEELGLLDDAAPGSERLTELAKEAEHTALAVKGITNSEGAGASFGSYGVGLVTSDGFSGFYEKTSYGLSCCVLAGEGVNMQRDYEYSTSPRFANLLTPAEIGKVAAERTLGKLNPIKIRSGKFPVIYDRRVSSEFLSYFISAISASRVARKLSFLEKAMDTKIFNTGINIIDDPKIPYGLGSKPYDADGVRAMRLQPVQDGVLTCWLSNVSSAKQLKIANNGRGSRSGGAASSPAPTNLYMEAGSITPEDLRADISYGLLVTETIGNGLNEVTGDYSIGVSGFLIENGTLTSAVSEVTVAGNLLEMFMNFTPANDLIFKNRMNSPSLRVEGLTIAGE